MGQWTLDNAGTCNTSMEKIERCCSANCIPFDANGNRNRLERYEAALLADPVGKARSIVSACRSSGQRRADLRETIINGNESKCWELREVQLLRDVETRWSSLFGMVGRVIELYPAVQVLLHKPKYASLISHLFTKTEWQVLNDIHHVLEEPHGTQELLSAEKTPTLSIALPAFELLVDSWLNLQKTIPELSHFIGVGIAKIQEYVIKCRQSRIFALAMIINPSSKLDWIQRHWTEQEAKDAREWMLEAVCIVY
ncbi:hypothetical protein B0H34DRAFT_784669 [Crassisporium funariophilum]|nr:hypothetical protein B0H34DRAFT_784669 [Crassisporium funariophilum]